MRLEQDIIVEPDEDAETVARSLIACKSKATLVEIKQYPGAQWPTAVYEGTKHQLAAVAAKANGSPIGRPRKDTR